MSRSRAYLFAGKLLAVGFLPLLLNCIFPGSLRAQATLENPEPHSAQSGIGVILGWACQATRIEIAIDGAKTQAAYGTGREDTRSVCGDANNGFGLLFNWSLLDAGPHTVSAWADGTKFAEVQITVASFGTEFLTGASGEFIVD